MPRRFCPNPDCTCHSFREFPQTLTELAQHVPVVALDCDASMLAEAGTCLEDGLFLTSNDCALMVSRGALAPMSDPEGRWDLSESYANLRFDATKNLRVFRSDPSPETGLHRSLSVAGMDGRIQHKILVRTATDEMLATSLPSFKNRTVFPRKRPARVFTNNVISLCEVRKLRQMLDHGNFDDFAKVLVTDARLAWGAALKRIGGDRVHDLNVRVLPAFLGHLARSGMPFRRMVANGSVAQVDCGPLKSIATHKRLVFANTRTGAITLDLSHTDTFRSVQVGEDWQLELFNRESGLQFVMCRDSSVQPREWADLVLSLPA